MGTQFTLAQRDTAPQFLAHVSCGQMAGWIKMPLGMELGLSPADFVLDVDPTPLLKKGAQPPIFGPCPLWLNGWMDQDGTWHGGGPQSKPHCVRWRPSSPPQKKGPEAPVFSPFLLWPNGWMHLLGMEGFGPDHIVLDADLAPPLPKKGEHSPQIIGPRLLWPNSWMDQDATW